MPDVLLYDPVNKVLLTEPGGQHLLLQSQADCCCGGVVGCPNCADPLDPDNNHCPPLDIPLSWYRGSTYPVDKITAVQMSVKRKGKCSFAFRWRHRNDYDGWAWGSGSLSWNRVDTMLLPGPRTLCGDLNYFSPMPPIRTNFNYSWQSSNNTYESTGTLFIGSASYDKSPSMYSQNSVGIFGRQRGIYTYQHGVSVNLPNFGSIMGHSIVDIGSSHLGFLDVKDYILGGIGIGDNRFTADDANYYQHEVNIGKRSFGNIICSMASCMRVNMRHSGEFGFARYSFQNEVSTSASCLIETNGNTLERDLGDGSCGERKPPPSSIGLLGGIGAAEDVVDPIDTINIPPPTFNRVRSDGREPTADDFI